VHTYVQVQGKFEAAIQTEEIKTKIQERLLQERARLEKGVEEKIASERKLQLLRKRKEQEQRLKEQVRLVFMLCNRWVVF
jgi:predicted RNA-binding protein